MEKNKLIIITGPTAVGKSSVALNLAKELNLSEKYPRLEIVNFDSLLFYKNLNIGTAKPTAAELQEVKHHLVDIGDIKNPLDASIFIQMARQTLLELKNENKVPILVGGSGFYLKALANGMYDSSPTPQNIKEKSDSLYQMKGIEVFRTILKEKDIDTFNRLHPNDHYRIRRAVEHFWTNNTPFSTAKNNLEDTTSPNYYLSQQWDLSHIHLDIPKEIHWSIILDRTKKMIEQGLIDEVQQILKNGATGNERPLKSIGYKEVQQYLAGEIPSIDLLVEKIYIATRQLAKSQRTWFKKIGPKTIFNPLDSQNSIFNYISSFLDQY